MAAMRRTATDILDQLDEVLRREQLAQGQLARAPVGGAEARRIARLLEEISQERAELQTMLQRLQHGGSRAPPHRLTHQRRTSNESLPPSMVPPRRPPPKESHGVLPVARSQGIASRRLSQPPRDQLQTLLPTEESADAEEEAKLEVDKWLTVFFEYKSCLLRVEPRYRPVDIIGSGAYGIVCAAEDQRTKEVVCIKQVERACSRRGVAKRTLRELLFLRHLGKHENIMLLYRVMCPPSRHFTHIYLVCELMETDLACVIRSRQALSDDHVQFFIYQLLRGVQYMHSAGIVHRDIKPRNLLVNSNCDLKICDFGLARFLDDSVPEDPVVLSDYVATRWYRAPEIILDRGNYGTAADVWSIGCVLAELLVRKALFPGQNEIDQLHLIQHVLDVPDEAMVPRNGKKPGIRDPKPKRALHFAPTPRVASVNAYSQHLHRYLRKHAPSANPAAIDLCVKLLSFYPQERLTIEQAMRHPYLRELHEAEDTRPCAPIDPSMFAFERLDLSKEQLKTLVYEEVMKNNDPADGEFPIEKNVLFVEDSRKKKKRKKKKRKGGARERRKSF